MEYDLGIIGSGPAGYTASLYAGQNKQKVVLFEKDLLGGTCLNRGCIPTKSFLHCAEIYETVKNCANFGVNVENYSFDFNKAVEYKNNIVEKLRNNLQRSLINSNVEIINKEAKVIDKNTILCDGQKYLCKKIIVATGSIPKQIKGLEFDKKLILSSDDILNLETLPKSIAIVGSGAIGIEFSRILSAFEVEVHLIEIANNLLPLADIEISKRLERSFKSKGIKFYTKTKIEQVDKQINSVRLKLENGTEIVVDCVLSAVGRSAGNIEKIDGVKYIGDVTSSIQLAHFASKQALKEVLDIPFDETLVPSVIYGNPEIAWIGKTEQELQNEVYQKSMIPISALAKSQCDDATDGMIKILTQNDKVIGVHIMSKEASSLIQPIIVAMQNDITTKDLKSICYAHPTYSEGIFECLMRLK